VRAHEREVTHVQKRCPWRCLCCCNGRGRQRTCPGCRSNGLAI
jgi:hypothetical protein